jgi:hypothetical protein
MIKSPPKEGPDTADTKVSEGKADVLDPFANVHERYHECASAVTATYWSKIQATYREYVNAVEAAQTVRDPELRREALQVATDKYGQACKSALDTADRDSEKCYVDYVRGLQEAWRNIEVQRTTTGAITSIAQAMLHVSWRASGNCIY